MLPKDDAQGDTAYGDAPTEMLPTDAAHGHCPRMLPTEMLDDPKGGSFQMLFDSFDLFLGNTSCKEMGKKLSDLIKVGDHIKYNAILIKSDKPLERDIRYLATAVVFASTQTLMRTRDIPGMAPKVTQVAQLEPGKVKNFHTVTGLMAKTKVTDQEKKLIADLEAGDKKGSHLQIEIDSDDEIEVLPTNSTNKATPSASGSEMSSVNAELEALIKQFNIKDLRKLLMTYMTHLAGVTGSTRQKINLTPIASGVKLDKGLASVEKLFIAVGKKCQLDPKGMKVGQVFLSQAQVKNILAKGILGPDHIERAGQKEQKTEVVKATVATPTVAKPTAAKPTVAKPVAAKPADPLSLIGPDKLRKLLRSYMELLKQGTTLEDIAKAQELPAAKVKELLVDVTARCKAAPMVEGRRSGFKLLSFFVNSTWVAKICTSGLTE